MHGFATKVSGIRLVSSRLLVEKTTLRVDGHDRVFVGGPLGMMS